MFIIGTGIALVLIVLLHFCTVKGVCPNFRDCFKAGISILMMLLAIVINLIAVISLLISILVMNGCYITEKTLNDPTFSASFAAGLTKLMKECVYENASGKASKFIGDTTKLDEMTNLTKTFSEGFSKYNPRANPSTRKDSVALEKYTTELLSKWTAYTLPGLATASENHMTVINSENNQSGGVRCLDDRLAPTPAQCPVDTPAREVSLAGTAANYKTTGTPGICIDIATWAHTMTDRYTGTCNDARKAQADKIQDCVKDFNTEIVDFTTALNPDTGNTPNAKSKLFYLAMDNIETSYKSISTAMSDSSAIFGGLKDGIDEFLNCKIIRSEMRNAVGNSCVEFGKNFAIQAIIISIIGPLLWLLSCCVCCSYRQSKAFGKLKKLQKRRYEDIPKEEQQDNKLQYAMESARMKVSEEDHVVNQVNMPRQRTVAGYQ